MLNFAQVLRQLWKTPTTPAVSDPFKSSVSSQVQDLSGKYLTFFIGAETYGIPVLKVREIIRMLPITQVPQVQSYMKGVINLRGRVIPVIDLRAKFSMPEADATTSTCTVVAQVSGRDNVTKLIGLIVDAVDEVAHISSGDIEPPPDFGGTINVSYLRGMAKVKNTVKILIDIDMVVAADTIESITDPIAA